MSGISAEHLRFLREDTRPHPLDTLQEAITQEMPADATVLNRKITELRLSGFPATAVAREVAGLFPVGYNDGIAHGMAQIIATDTSYNTDTFYNTDTSYSSSSTSSSVNPVAPAALASSLRPVSRRQTTGGDAGPAPVTAVNTRRSSARPQGRVK